MFLIDLKINVRDIKVNQRMFLSPSWDFAHICQNIFILFKIFSCQNGKQFKMFDVRANNTNLLFYLSLWGLFVQFIDQKVTFILNEPMQKVVLITS